MAIRTSSADHLAAESPPYVGNLGVSVVICCHNSETLLPKTLEHLKSQIVGDAKWEVVVIDNGSTDGTAQVAAKTWVGNVGGTSLRVIKEPRLGLVYARERGISESVFEFICFVDDDNRVSPNWIQTVFDIMSKKPEIGACGGLSRGEFDSAPPTWFDQYAHLYAVMPQTDLRGDVTTQRTLWGAGLTVRRSALKKLTNDSGYRSILTGRMGKSLSSGEDTELCLALRITGWRLWLEPSIYFDHYLPARRLEWNYLRKLAYGSARATPAHDAFFCATKPPRYGIALLLRKIRETWLWQFTAALLVLLRHPTDFMRSLGPNDEIDHKTILVEFRRGRLAGLASAMEWYGRRHREIRQLASSARSFEPSQ